MLIVFDHCDHICELIVRETNVKCFFKPGQDLSQIVVQALVAADDALPIALFRHGFTVLQPIDGAGNVQEKPQFLILIQPFGGDALNLRQRPRQTLTQL